MKSSTPITPISKVTGFGFLISLALVLLLPVPAAVLSAETPDLSASFVQNLPFDNLSSQEADSLQRGERVFRVLDSYKDVSLNPTGGPGRAERRELLSLIDDVRPNFLAEMMMVIPVENDRDNLFLLKDILLDVEAFDNIPYYSVQNERWYDLFEDAEDKLVVYGAGGARVGFFFNLFSGERMDNAFIGRVEAFFSWFNDEHIKKLRVYEP